MIFVRHRIRQKIYTADFQAKKIHPYFHRISTVLVIKTQKKRVKIEKFTPLAKNLHIAAGREGSDKSHL